MARAPHPILLALTLLVYAPAGCDSSGGGPPHGPLPDADAVENPDASGDAADAGRDAPDAEPPSPRPFVAVTFNTGTSDRMAHDRGDDGYTSDHAALSDQWYGNGLAWIPAVDAARAFFAAVDPDVVTFQELFWSGRCPDIPEEAHEDFVCETWGPGDPTVAQAILPGNWQVMCHPGKPDKCAAVNRRFGSFRGCDADYCLEGLDGAEIDGCGSGSRVGRGVIDRVGGGTLTLVNVHGSSGFGDEEAACRVEQFEQVFVDLDGAPAAHGDVNLVMGDFNTDPVRLAGGDASADRLMDFAGPGEPFRFITEVGEDATPTYAGYVNIDHVISDALDGDCWAAGVTEGRPPVLDAVYFDHVPIVCDLEVSAP
ncbi:MAG: endonuclease/exonuclease/phosphatase family protein [Myxococcota bacterium]